MPSLGYVAASKEISGGAVPGIMLLHGDDPFLQSELLRLLKDALRLGGEVDAVELQAGGGEGDEDGNGSGRAPAFDLKSLATEPPFWFARRLIVAPSSAFAAMSPYLGLLDGPDSRLAAVFLYPRKGAPPKKLSSYVEKKGGWVVECVLKGNELRQWASEGAASLGVSLPNDAFNYLSFLCGGNPASLAQEIRKATAYLGEERIVTVDALKAVGCRSGESSVFELVDAVVENHSANIREKLADLLEQGQAPYMILFMVARHFLQLLEAVLLRDEGRAKNAGDLARELGLHPYPAGKLWSQAGSVGVGSVTAILRSLLEADLLMKTGRGDSALLLESALAEIVRNL